MTQEIIALGIVVVAAIYSLVSIARFIKQGFQQTDKRCNKNCDCTNSGNHLISKNKQLRYRAIKLK